MTNQNFETQFNQAVAAMKAEGVAGAHDLPEFGSLLQLIRETFGEAPQSIKKFEEFFAWWDVVSAYDQMDEGQSAEAHKPALVLIYAALAEESFFAGYEAALTPAPVVMADGAVTHAGNVNVPALPARSAKSGFIVRVSCSELDMHGIEAGQIADAYVPVEAVDEDTACQLAVLWHADNGKAVVDHEMLWTCVEPARALMFKATKCLEVTDSELDTFLTLTQGLSTAKVIGRSAVPTWHAEA